MKYFILSLLLLFSSTSYANTQQLTPLCEEQGKLLWYRTLMIEGSYSELKEIICELDIPEATQRDLARIFLTIEFNLGYPVDFNVFQSHIE